MLISGSSNPQIIGENGNHVTLIENVLDNNLPQSFTIKLTVNSICGISEILQVIDLSADCRDHQIIDGCTETISQKKTTVQFNEIFNESTNPVIITGPITNNDVGQFSSIVTNKTSQEFDIQSLSWDGSPIITGDQISYLYGEESILKFGEFKAQFGVATSIGIIENYVTFLQEFDETPIVFLTPNSGIEDQVFKVDIHSVSKEGFYFKTNFKEQELPNYNVEIGFIAAEPGFGYVNEKLIYVGEVNKSDSTNWTTLEFGEYFNTTPLIFLSAQSSTENNVGGFRITNLDENHFDFSINSIPSVSNIVKDKVGFILLENNVSCNCDLNFSFNQEIKPVTCGEDNNGSIVLNPTGGLSPYNIYWDDGNTGNTLDNLKGGEYFVQVIDRNGCDFDTTFTVPVFEELGIASIETINTSCNESNGSIHIIPYGGNGPYAIEWSHGASNFLEENLISGIYVATISDSETCYTEVEVEIIEFSVESQIENSVCGQPNGSIDLMIQGGQRPFLIDWDNGYNSPSINGLFAGSYSYTVTDLTGCNVQSSINLEDITTLNITSNGGDEGFSNGKFLPQGTNLFWKFDPRRIADRLTIVSSVEGIILDSGNMSSFSGCSCFNGCECVNMVYLADNCSSTIPLVVGSGTVSECIDQCPDGPYPKTAYFIAGELHLEHDAFISINVEGSVCETPGTYWILDVSCAPLNTNHEHDLNFRELNESKNDELKTYPIPSTKHIFIESPPSLLADGLRIINNVGMELIKINNIESSKYKIDITSLDSGIYFLEYQVFGIVKLEKFIVVN